MNETNDYSKRRFAGFIAARLDARRREQDHEQRLARNSRNATPSRPENGSPGNPTETNPGQKPTSLPLMILALTLATLPAAGEPGHCRAATLKAGTARVPLLDDEGTWKKLPAVISGGGQRLPNWARALVGSLPRTTAAMLDLDRIHRTKSPLGPLLRGKMRWIAARANHCDYSMAYAEADLKRAGISETELRVLQGDHKNSPHAERDALDFAHQMTVDASEVTDLEVADLISRYGEEKVVAMVLLLAYANFQDRMLLALGIPIESGGPMPAPEIVFDRKAKPPEVPPRKRPEERPIPKETERIDDPFWHSLDFGDLQQRLTEQRSRAGRIRVPTWEQVLRVLPAEIPKPEKPVRIRWSLVTMGYQPEMAAAWSACTRAFGAEAKQDRVFEESLFWIVTRTIHCFY
jgi:alkylhydroperoxidase family enzyme